MLERIVRSGIVVVLGAVALAGAVPAVAQAECSTGDWPPPADVAAYRGHLFDATVSDVQPATEEVADWYATLRIARQYRGSVADPLELHGWSVGCSHLDGSRLREGDRIMVSIDRMNSSLYGPLLIWRQVGDGWRFYDAVLRGSHDDYPSATRGSRSTGDIVALVGPGTLPETDAAVGPDLDDDTAPGSGMSTLVVIIAALAASGMVRRLRQPS